LHKTEDGETQQGQWTQDQWRNFGTSVNKHAFGTPANGTRVFRLVAGRHFDLTKPSLSFGESRGFKAERKHGPQPVPRVHSCKYGFRYLLLLSVPAVESQSYLMCELMTNILPVPAVESGTGDINTYLYETILVDSPQSYSMCELTTEESLSVSACTHNAPQFLWVHV
jgi:hypothetical protein